MAAAPAPSDSNSAEWDWRIKLGLLQKRYGALKNKSERPRDLDESDYDSEDDERDDDLLWKLLRGGYTLVNKAQQADHPDAAEILERVQALNNDLVNLAVKRQLGYAGVKSFADRPGTLVKDAMHSFMGATNGDRLADAMANFLGSLLGRPASPPAGRTLTPWAKHQQPHSASTRLSRFRDGIEFPSPDNHPFAAAVLQARCEVYEDIVSDPIRMAISPSGACLAVISRAGYKQRDPTLQYWLPGDDPKPQQHYVDPRLIATGINIVLDDDRKLMFVDDRDRIKSYSWDGASGRPVHTMNSMKSHDGPLALLPGGRLIRGGMGSALCWDLDALETHGPGPKYKRIGKGKYSWANCMRDRANDDEEEYSTGSLPTTTIAFADKAFEPRTLHPVSGGHVLAGEDPERGYACLALDLEHGGATAARYIGHAGTITGFSTSGGDANAFLTSCADGYARLYDRRAPLPVLTFDVEKRESPLLAAVLAHVDGLPVMFSGGVKSEGIKCWDVRAQKCVYELSTGNTEVAGLAWSDAHKTLYATGGCSHKDWMGAYHGYRDFEMGHIRDSDILGPRKRGEPMEREPFWPDRAIHIENAFGYAYDAGSHVMLSYRFKEQPELDVLPDYGDGEPMDDDWF
ncbi:WD40 repeat domain-containing protein [Phanerochaete sordida]|uniref:WD40 repeat domain-containing protein n=1 Tax=Phanerochaete sordida TaxID=48140 RepID=A0A9P3GJE5_9APHY|nr:WD40 repeat domain-containing protein [Phanerochaete sordida]